MQFIIIGKDGKDDEALGRRLKARDNHLSYSEEAAKRGEQLMAAAMLDEDGQMNGSVMIVEFDDRDALDHWLENEAYVTGEVWKDVLVIPCKVAPTFSK